MNKNDSSDLEDITPKTSERDRDHSKIDDATQNGSQAKGSSATEVA